jgi:hypothetical protein
MMVIRSQQLEAFAAAQRHRFKNRLMAHLNAVFSRSYPNASVKARPSP